MPLPFLKYIHTEGKVFLPVEGQREKSKTDVFGSGDVKEVSAIKQSCYIPKRARQLEAEVLLFMGKGQS